MMAALLLARQPSEDRRYLGCGLGVGLQAPNDFSEALECRRRDGASVLQGFLSRLRDHFEVFLAHVLALGRGALCRSGRRVLLPC